MLLTLVPPARSADLRSPAGPHHVGGRGELPVDLLARRRAVDDAVRAVAGAPVRHLPAALLDALQGSWGTPEELLGAAPRIALAR